jgi:hypothetical protein
MLFFLSYILFAELYYIYIIQFINKNVNLETIEITRKPESVPWMDAAKAQHYTDSVLDSVSAMQAIKNRLS